MSFMTAFGWASIMLCMGVFLRAKVSFLRKMLVPASVIAGVLGFGFINLFLALGVDVGTDSKMYTEIVNHLFTVSFISISLTSTSEKKENTSKDVLKGAVALGFIWCLLYAVTPVLAAGTIACMGKGTDMDQIYGMLVPFAFCQGPGQAAAYGVIMEQFGWQDAAVVGITFSAIGFIAAFLVGVPAAKKGIQRGIARHCGKLDTRIEKGYLEKDEQTEYMVKDTTCNSNIETLAFHFALIGVCYILAVGISKVLGRIPGFLGASMSGMMFMNGMYAAYLVKWLMKCLKIDFLQESTLQSKITGWTADYLVVCAFMAVSVSIIHKWLTPILFVSFLTTLVTMAVCFYFGQRIGGSNDFERTLGIYGTCTGTVPSGISLIRIVDPNFQTATAVELGACNLVMLASTPVYILILALASGSISLIQTMAGLTTCAAGYLAALKITKSWGRKTYSWR